MGFLLGLYKGVYWGYIGCQEGASSPTGRPVT